MNPVNETPHVIVVGAGFGGLQAATTLAKEGFRVTLVDRHPYSTFQPLLYQVATGGLNPGDVTYSLRFFAAKHKGVRFRRTVVVGIDHDAREVICDDDIRLHYDYLVLATGITTNHFGIPGAAEYSMSMYTRAEALRVRDTIFGSLEIIASDPEPDVQKRFTVLITGGGATGVEMAGQLAELKRDALPATFPELAPERVRVVLVEMAPYLLAPFDDSLRRYAYRELVKRGVEVRLDTAIAEVQADHVDFADGTSMPVDLVVWAAGVGGSPLVREWGVPVGKGGRIEVNADYRVLGEERIFAIGDGAANVGNPLPQLAQPAIQGGKHVAKQIARLHRGLATEEFSYFNKGTMATIGRGDAVLEIPAGIKMSGLPAWLGWMALHLMYLLGGRNRLQTMLNLGARYFGPRRSNVIVGDVLETPKLREIRTR